MTSSCIAFGSAASSAQVPSPSTAATGASLSWSVGIEGSNRGGRGGKGGIRRSAWSRGPPQVAAHSGQSQSPPTFGYQDAIDWSVETEGDDMGDMGGTGGYGRSAWSRGPPAVQSGQSQSPPAPASQDAGQDNAKGKGKGKKKRNKKSKSTGQSQADSLHEKAQELKIEESSEEICFICAESIKYYSVSKCNHRTCHLCALRMRALYKKLECTLCKEPQQSVVFTTSPDKPYEKYNLGLMINKDSKLSVFFETQKMMEETLNLLKSNCPDPNCDYIGNGWGDLKLHTRTVHNRLICDLCVRNKQVFAHEHVLYPPARLPLHLPSMLQRHKQNVPKDQIEGGVHPMCEFCRECFFGDDELYAHCRERHEECFVCKRNEIRNQYFQDYDSLEKHFREAHHPCTQSECLARKFVVFDTLLDLKAHMVEEHGGEMSPRDRREARRVVADFTFDDRHDHGRRDGYYSYDRGQERGRERESPPWQSQASARQRRRWAAFGARLTIDEPTSIGESNILANQPAIWSNRMHAPTREDVDPTGADCHGPLISHLQLLAPNPTTAIPAAKAAIRGYCSSESSARAFISTIWNILDRNLEHTESIVNAFVDLLDEEEKKQDLLASWRDFAFEQRREFPDLVPNIGRNYAAIATEGVLSVNHSTTAGSSQSPPRAWNHVARLTRSSMTIQPSSPSIASSSQSAASETFSPRFSMLSSSSSSSYHSAMRSPSQNQRTTPWTYSSVASYGAPGPSTTSYSNSKAETDIQVVVSPLPAYAVSRSPVSSPTSVLMSGAGVSQGNNAELVALLTNGPGAVGNYASPFAADGANNVGTGKMGKLKHRGLINSGNMCFANSVLQMLVYTVPFQRLFFDIGRLRSTGVGLGKGKKDASTTPLVDAMVEFVKEFVVTDAELYEGNVRSGNVPNAAATGWGKGKEREWGREYSDEDELWESGGEDELWGTESFLPSYVYEAIQGKKKFDDMRQDDAEEFLGFLLETLEEELILLKEALTGTSLSLSSGWQEIGKKKRTVVTRTIKSTESPITKIFGGKFRTTLKVPRTKKDSAVVEDWRLIRLDIQRDQIYTIEDAMAYISQPQLVQVTNPARPGTTLEARQVVHIDALPPVLVLHLKRFCFDTSVGGIVKVDKQVTFGPELEIVNDVISPAIRKSQPPKYKLFGVLYHHGLSAFGGFYTLDVLHPTRFSSSGGGPREGWIRIFDELASDVRHEDVFGGDGDDNRSAYLLFYRRIR